MGTTDSVMFQNLKIAQETVQSFKTGLRHACISITKVGYTPHKLTDNNENLCLKLCPILVH